ncbi:uncharacterized protein RCC_01319 [Ramularia collo-cygni]|uniref:F-box domain-containing protein n=1 Tax=Ramularia collo-cygni TaxID=112498 RepID=A0A2D3V5B6_9PEZI|nr:uncharacterized protein RCC_01319 [Ramularia collo-cygni]CZT15463.1 uncharacterized protein RCC_01319 [Ramularia collo-cygni]
MSSNSPTTMRGKSTIRLKRRSPASIKAKQFRDRMDSLPPELWEMIYKLTFTPSSNTTIDVTCTRPGSRPWFRLIPQPPSEPIIKHSPEIPFQLMQVDRMTRAMFMAPFLKSTTFIVEDISLCEAWTRHMPSTIVKKLRDVRCLKRAVAPWFRSQKIPYCVDPDQIEDFAKMLIRERAQRSRCGKATFKYDCDVSVVRMRTWQG